MKNNFTLTFALLLCLFWIEGNAQTQFWSDTFDASPTSGTRTPEENGGLGGPPNTSYFRLTDGSTVSVAYAKNTAIIAQRYRKDAFSDDDNEILKRFARVFEQAYTRFLDLQKSEAQARESQIQLALERVRARTMAMQHSSELSETSALLFQQIH